ncbi:MAG: hypothetical protein WEB58_05015 [Planctomycetaceae bacterium]
MKSSDLSLFDAFPPVTDNIGFVQGNIDEIIALCDGWLIPQRRPPAERFCSRIEDAIERMFPTNLDRLLFVQCKSGWTALFHDLHETTDSKIGYITSRLKRRGLLATYIEDH